MRTDKEVVARAMSAVGKGCVYALGAGGRDPSALYPWHDVFRVPDTADPVTKAARWKVYKRACDCSGFAAWVYGVARRLDPKVVPFWEPEDGNWFETSALARDAERPLGMVNKVPWSQALPGMMLVYGDRVVNGQRHQGHVGVITEVSAGLPTKVVHCSLGNWKHRGDAILETSADNFLNRAIAASVAWVDYGRAA